MRGQTLSFSPAVGQTVIQPSHARTMARSRTRMTVDASPTLPANDAEPDAPVAQEDRYTNRELSWLSFNRRVLAESENESYPLLERLRFLSISANNLDEFTMVRIAGLEGQVQRGIETQAIDGASPRQQLAAIREQLLQLEDRQQASLDTLSALLAEEGIILAPVEALSDEQQGWLAAYFESDILPLITPQAIDPSHPFPFVANKGIGVIFRLKRGKRQADLIEMVLIPSGAPRFVRVPGEQAIYVAIEQLVTRLPTSCSPVSRFWATGFSACCATAISRSRKKPRTSCAISAPQSSGAGAAMSCCSSSTRTATGLPKRCCANSSRWTRT